MSVLSSTKPRVMELADLIDQDILARGLRPGDQYLSTIDTARMLKVNTTHANKALQLLVQRRRLKRKQRLGTIVADPGDSISEPILNCVHLLVHQNYLQTEGLLADGVVMGMQRELTGANVRFNFMPLEDQAETVNHLLSDAMRSSKPEGFVLVRSTLTTQRLLAQSGLPTVVFGSLHPSVTGLSRIDRDQRQIGMLATEYLLKRGLRRILALVRERVLPGDHPYMDGIRQAMADGGLGVDALIIRNLPADAQAVAAEVASVVAGQSEPTGIIARSEPLALGAAQAIERLTKRMADKTAIVVSDVYRRGGERALRFPYIASTWTPEEIGHHIGRMLANQVRGEFEQAEIENIPTALQTR